MAQFRKREVKLELFGTGLIFYEGAGQRVGKRLEQILQKRS
jgi:hypothetical protein